MRTKLDPNSDVGRIRAYFKDNPEEELTISDMAKKFDLTKQRVRNCLQTLRRQKAVFATPVLYRGVK